MSINSLLALPFTSASPPIHHAGHTKRAMPFGSNRPPCTLHNPSTYPVLCPATQDSQFQCLSSGLFTTMSSYTENFLFLSADEQERILPVRKWFGSADACKEFCAMYEDGSLVRKWGECLQRECTDFEGFPAEEGVRAPDDLFGMACIGLGLMEMPEKMKEEMDRFNNGEMDAEVKKEEEVKKGGLVDQSKEGKVKVEEGSDEEWDSNFTGTAEKVVRNSAGMKTVGWKGMAVAAILFAGIFGGAV